MIYDVAIIGLGPAGYKFAQLALGHGLSVICFEKNFCGGTCLNLGCIPTKTILHDAESNVTDWNTILTRKDSIVEKFKKAVEKDLINKGAKIIFNEATINNDAIYAANEEFKYKRIIVATGSKPLEIKGLEFDGDFILSSDDLFKLAKIPKSIVIVGSGAIGIEWARIFSALGSEVTIIEKAPNLLPAGDCDISKRLERIFKMRKIKFYKDCEVLKIEKKKLFLSNGETLETERILVAVGRKSIKLENTLGDNIFEIGDANTEGTQIKLAHYATAQAQRLFEHLYKDVALKNISPLQVPSVVYGTPEIASIGFREQDAPKDAKIHNLPIAFLAKAHCDGNIEGFIKIITDSYGKIIGAHIFSNEASALISQIAILMKFEATISDVQDIIFPHPTLSEGIFEALSQ